MRESASSSQYVIPPPDIPEFMYKHFPAITAKKLIAWAKSEFYARLQYLSERGYYKEHKWTSRNMPPIRILAEMSGFRKICAFYSTLENWNKLNKEERDFIRKSYDFRDILFRSNGIN